MFVMCLFFYLFKIFTINNFVKLIYEKELILKKLR